MLIITILAFALTVLLAPSRVLALYKPNVPEVDRIRLAEAFRLGDRLGNRVWKAWNQVPFAVVLVTQE